MYTNKNYDKYKDNNIFTAPKEELTLMLYEGALKFSNQAIMAIENKDFTKSNELLIRVQDIFRELQITLDFKYEISEQLSSLYEYVIGKCVQGNLKKDIEIISEARDMIREFRDTWKEAVKLARSSQVKSM